LLLHIDEVFISLLYTRGGHTYSMYEPHIVESKLQRAVTRGVTKGGQGGHDSPGAESLWGRRITAGRQMTAEGAEKSQQCHKYFLQCSTFASERPQFRTWGRQTCFLPRAPPNLVTPLAAT